MRPLRPRRVYGPRRRPSKPWREVRRLARHRRPWSTPVVANRAGWPPRARIHAIPAAGCPAGIVQWARCQPPGRRPRGASSSDKPRVRLATPSDVASVRVLLPVRTVMVGELPGSSAFMRPRAQCFIRRVAAFSSRLRSPPGRNAPVASFCRHWLADSAEHLLVPADRRRPHARRRTEIERARRAACCR